jgi:hypothetical protein
MNAQKKKQWMVGLLLTLLAVVGWNQQAVGSQPMASANSSSDVAGLARAIAQGVGEVQQSITQGTKGTVVVFEEYHTSRVGQLQIGAMLLRMYERYGLRLIGLEGAFQRAKSLDVTWFHNAGGATSQRFREDTAVRMLAEGEIGAAEFMAMIFSQVQVRGLEKEEEYSVRPDSEGNPVAVYLLKIAEKKLTQSDIRKINVLITEKKEKEAFDYIKNADPWVRRQFEFFDQKSISIPEMAQQAREIQNEAQRLGVEVEPGVREGLQKTLRFYETATQRSTTMTNYLVSLLGSKAATPVAMIIGAGHSKEVMEQLRSQNVSCALIRPIAFNPAFASLSMDEFERKNDLKWARIAEGTLGRLLNGHRRPPAVIETPTAQSYASAYMAVMVVSEAARGGKRVPDDVRVQLAGLPGLRIDFGSFKQDGYDVIFRMWLTGTDGREKELWARAGTADTPEQAKSLEEKLLRAIADLGGGGKMPPREPPSGSKGTGDREGPGDGKRDDVVISRMGLRSLAVFAESEQKVMAVGRISG